MRDARGRSCTITRAASDRLASDPEATRKRSVTQSASDATCAAPCRCGWGDGRGTTDARAQSREGRGLWDGQSSRWDVVVFIPPGDFSSRDALWISFHFI